MENTQQLPKTKVRNQRNIALFAVVVVLWLVFDRMTKNYFDALYMPGEVITDPILGVFQFFLVHNTGAAWGMFGDSTFMLGVTSTIVCALLLVYFIVSAKRMNLFEVFGLALVFAGGIGNAIDRFSLNYVVDFINFTFINFPVFNIADIGVTCGFILFFVGILLSWRQESIAEGQVKAETCQADPAVGFVEDKEEPSLDNKEEAAQIQKELKDS